MIMSRKLARRRMLIWCQQRSSTVTTIKTYIFMEGNAALEEDYTGTLLRTSFTDGKIVLTPTFHSNDNKDWFNHASIYIQVAGLNKYESMHVEGYFDGNIKFTENDGIFVGHGSSNIANSHISVTDTDTNIKVYSFNNMNEFSDSNCIGIEYNRDEDSSYREISSSFYITNIWLERLASEDGGDEEEPETPTPQTFRVSITGENFTFEGSTGENAAIENTDYTASIIADDGYKIESVTVVVDDNQIDSFTFINGVLTISGEDVTGDIVINVVTIEEIVEPEEPEEPEESTLWVYEYGKDSLSNGELIDNPQYSNIVKQGITYNYDGGYLFVHKNTLASGADNIPSMIIGGINLVDYDKIYIEYICKLGSTVSPTHPEDHLYIGYGKTTSINSTAFTDYVSEWNILNVQRAEFDISGITDSSIQYYIKAVFKINVSAENTGIKIKNIWLERLASEDGGDEEEPETPIEPEEPEANTYNVIVNTGNFAFYGENTATSGVDYVATITANDGCYISSVESTIDNEQIGNYSNGTLTIPGADITGDINIAISTDAVQNEAIYLFDSSSEDNFIFGEYRYSDDSGVIMTEASTSWPPANSDGINTSSNCIILSGGNGGTMDLGEPTFLYLEDNSSGLEDSSSGLSAEGMLCNNVSITLGGKVYEPREAGIPFGTYTLKVKGYKTGTESDGFVDYGNGTYDKLISINSTSEQTYEAEIEIVKNGRFQFASTSGSGDVVITDIWLEEIE